MSYRLMHLALATHGAPTTGATLEAAVALARTFSASLSVTLPRLKVRAPSHFLAGRMLAGLAADLEKAAADKARELEASLRGHASDAGVRISIETVEEIWPQNADAQHIRGRASDLSILMMPKDDADGRLQAESWIFETGRPCLAIPEAFEGPFSLKTCCIAWDGGKQAARAVGDALPLIHHAERVVIIVARNEKMLPDDVEAPLARLLEAHDVKVVVDIVDVDEGDAGSAILNAADRHAADVLIMGAYGHSRLREFVLGGATRSVLANSVKPLLLSH